MNKSRKTTANIGLDKREIALTLAYNDLNKNQTAKNMGISPGTLYYWTGKYPAIEIAATQINSTLNKLV